MGTEIKSWEIREGRLVPVDSRLVDGGRLETLDLEAWIASDPTIVRPGLRIIGRQVMTRSGPIDLLAIDRSGDLVIIELKRTGSPERCLHKPLITRLTLPRGRWRR
jgi:RecB family endonuclease NucS